MEFISTKKLLSNETVALGIIEIVSIPHKVIFGDFTSEIQLIEYQKQEFTKVFNEIYQIYKSINQNNNEDKSISLEILWSTYETTNQTFKANIRIDLLIRAIDFDEKNAKDTINSISNVLKTTLQMLKYEFKDIPIDDFIEKQSKVNKNSIKAIVKNERVENLQNQLMPCCYMYDQLPKSTNDLSNIIISLTDNPNSAISFQFIPTIFYDDEKAEIDRNFQALEILKRGIPDQSIGNVSFVNADACLSNYKYYSDHKNNPLFMFNVVVYGSSDSVQNIINKLYGQVSTGDADDTANLKVIDIYKEEYDIENNLYALPFALSETITDIDRDECIWNAGIISDSLYRLPYILTCEEISQLCRLPIGSDKVSAGLNINESNRSSKKYNANLIDTGDIILGKLKSSSYSNNIGIKLDDLAKHMLVVGTPGSGKTTFSVGLLDRLWKDHKIPFLVIEPAKNEYRALVQSIPELQIFTPGKNFISPFVYNPFVPPKNVKLETYKSTLKTAFAAGVSMVTPLDKIFEETINNCYSDFRWLDTYTINDEKGKIFNIEDFIKSFQSTFEKIGYTGDAANIGRAGLVRLKGLKNLFDNYYSIPIEDLLSKPTIIELAAIENSDQKALIIALVLLSILSYVNANYVGEGGLKNVILLEEAHVLLDASSSAGEGEADPSSIAKGLVKRMLAEIRSYGVGLIIADQSPRKVSTDVVALTDMKVVFRLVENEDKQIIGNSSNMSEVQIQRLAKLKPGEACLFFNRLEEAEEIITPNYRIDNNISISLSDDGIKGLSTYWNDKKEKLRPYPFCEVCKSCDSDCDYNIRVLGREVARRIYANYFNIETKEFDKVKEVFASISKLIRNELNDEELTDRLLTCCIVHLWRKIYYETKIAIKNEAIIDFLKKNR